MGQLKPWICDECGELNSEAICDRCGVDAPLSSFFNDEQNVARHMPLWGMLGIANMPRPFTWGCLIFLLSPVIHLLWVWVEDVFFSR